MADALTPETIAAAERLAGVSFTAGERAQMLDTLEGQLAALRARRAVALDNADAPACVFDPRLPGFAMPAQPADRAEAALEAAPLPDAAEDIAFAPLTRLAGWLRGGRLSSRRLTTIYLDRIARLDPTLNAFATVTPDLALAQADAADAALARGAWRGPLHGAPYALKDLFDTAGVATEWGAEPFAGRVPDADAAVTARLRDAGAVLLGKSAVGALAYGDVWMGRRTRNPWNPAEGSSGSSAGSAAATAAGLCAFAIGTETLGSIVSPSERCGATGLRPTFGRVSRAGAMALCWSLDKVGPICRAAADAALVLAALNGADPADPGSIAAPFAFDPDADLSGARVGYLPGTIPATGPARDALDAIGALGFETAPVALPELPYGSLLQILYVEAAAAFEDLTLDGRDDLLTRQDPAAWPNLFRQARFTPAVDLVQLDRLRRRVMAALDAAFGQVDFIVGPFGAGPLLVATNFTGHPCLHLRAGFAQTGARDGGPPGPPVRTPQGVSLWSGLFDEGRLCALGMRLEAALGVAEERPPL